MKKMDSVKQTAPWCPFSNKRPRLVLKIIKLWGCRKKKVRMQEEEAVN